jgi:hypothetical protein
MQHLLLKVCLRAGYADIVLFDMHGTVFLLQVLMSAGERAELGTEQYIAVSPILEGLVILKKNPDYMED